MSTQGCPCGFWNDPTRECRCTPLQIQRYVGRISGPLLDRIDIHIDVPAVKFRELTGDAAPETDSSNTIRARVVQARERQQQRLAEEKIFSNAVMTPRNDQAPLQYRCGERTNVGARNDAPGLVSASL
jgi:magnesium chelatase family protein